MSTMNYEKRKAKMLSMREKGESIQVIGDRFEISRERVRQIIGNTGRIAKNTFYPPELVETIRQMRLAQGLSSGEIGEKLGKPADGIRRILNKNGIQLRETNRTRFKEGIRKCSQCSEIKELSEFGRQKSDPDGLQRRCKICVCENTKKWYRVRKENA